MTAAYAAVLLTPNAPDRARLLGERLHARVADLGLTSEHFAVMDGAAYRAGESDGPVAAVYFGGSAQDPDATRIAEAFVQRGLPILPIFSPALGVGYPDQVPRVLLGVNGQADDGTDLALDAAANVILEALGLMRARRRVFISYRRAESRGVALQLAPELHAAGYQVFLDTQSVARGIMFQPALWDAMADTDLVLFLDTKTTLDSRWVAEEFALANELGVTVIHLVWPDHDRPREAELSEVMRLTADDFWSTAGPARASGMLRKEAIGRILAFTERLRAAAFAARRRRLVEGFVARVRRTRGTAHVDPGGAIRLLRHDGERAIVVPIVGAIESLHLEDAAAAHADQGAELRVLYRARGLRPRHTKHLRWLNDHLPVKLLELDTEVPAWL